MLLDVEIDKKNVPNMQEIHKYNPYYANMRMSDTELLAAHKKIFLKAIETNNEIAVEYMWINYYESEMEERKLILNDLPSFIDNPYKFNIFMFLLFQVNGTEFLELFNEKLSFAAIQNIIDDDRWHCVFLDVFKALQMNFTNVIFEQIFGLLTDSLCQVNIVGINLDIVITFFSLLQETVKIFIVEESTTATKANYYGLVLVEVLNNDDKELIQKLRIREYAILKAFLKSESGLNSLTEAFKNRPIKHILECLEGFIIIKEERTDIVNNFFIKRKDVLYDYFVSKGHFDTLKEFESLYLGLEEDISKFKLETLYKFNGGLIRKILFPANKKLGPNNLVHAKSFLKWCLESDENVSAFINKMDLISEEAPEEDSTFIKYYDEMVKCVLNSEFIFLSNFFKWKGIEKEEGFKLFKKLLVNEKTINDSVARMKEKNSFVFDFTSFAKRHHAHDDDIKSFRKRFSSK